jgi:ABC-type glycerol-3-phosphate transport system permease component
MGERAMMVRQRYRTAIKRTAGRAIVYLILMAGSAIMLLPLLWMLSTSLKVPSQITVIHMQWIPKPVAWRNYVEVFEWVPMARHFFNTMVVVIASITGAVLTCSLVGYGFARMDFPGREFLFGVLLSTMMIPWMASMIPLFVIFDAMGMVGTFWPLIIPRLLGHNAFYIFLMRQFFRGIPRELSDAALIDGCSEFGIWWRIIMPISTPVLAAVSIFAFQWAWNSFIGPLVYLGSKRELWTLTLALYNFRSFEGQEDLTHYLMVMAVMMAIPMLLVYAVGQRHFERAVIFSGIKG